MTSTDTYQLKWHSHSSHLNGSVASLLRSERFTDVVLCTMDGSQIPAHKFILSSCSVYLSNLFEGQRSVTRMGGMLYVVLPSEISTKALKILVEYMYKGETTVSNEVLDTVLKAGEVLKIRGLWRQTDEAGAETTAEKQQPAATTSLNKTPTSAAKKPDTDIVQVQQKIAVKKDDKLLKTFGPLQPQGGTGRPMFIGPPKLVFIKTNEGGAQMALRPGAPKGQTILVAPAPQQETITIPSTPSPERESPVEISAPKSPRVLRRQTERKYGKRTRTEVNNEDDKSKDGESADETSKKSSKNNSETTTEVTVKEEPEWDASSIEEEERSIAEMFQAEMSVKAEPVDEVDIEEESLDGEDCQVVEEEDNLRLEEATQHQNSSDEDNTGDLATLTPLLTEQTDTNVQNIDSNREEQEIESSKKQRYKFGGQHNNLPIDSQEALITFENNLIDPASRKYFMKKLSRLCCRRGKGTWAFNANFLVDFMFTRRFMTLCSWTGATKTGTTKICFKDFKNTVLFFFEVVYKSDKSFRLQTCENFFMKILRNSKTRHEARGLVTSAPKCRLSRAHRFGNVDPGCVSDVDTSNDEVDNLAEELTILSQSQTNVSSLNPKKEEIATIDQFSQNIPFSIKDLPIDSADTLTTFEESLKDPAAKKMLERGFSLVCYKRGSGTGLYNAYVLVDYMFTRRFMTTCSWAGGSRNQLTKTCFRAYRRTIHFFYEIIGKFDQRFTFRHCEIFFKNVLKNAISRNKSNQTRRSAPKARGKKVKDDSKKVEPECTSEVDQSRDQETSDVDQNQVEKAAEYIATIGIKPDFKPNEFHEVKDSEELETFPVEFTPRKTKLHRRSETETKYDFCDFPIESVDSLKTLEQKLTDPKFRKVMRKKFMILCHKQGRGSGPYNAYTLVDHMFTRKFMVACSWNGGSRDGSARTRFKSFRNTIEFFFEVINQMDSTFTVRDCIKFFGNVLRNANRRSQSKQMKRSAPKKRPKTRAQKTSDEDKTEQEQPPLHMFEPGNTSDIERLFSQAGPSHADPMNLEDSIEVELTQDILSQIMPVTSQYASDFEITSIHEGLPVDSEESLISLENQLNDPDFRNKLQDKLLSVCSKQGEGTALHNAYILVDYMFTRKFFTLCSWAGGSKGENPKICFKMYKKTIQFFFNLLSTLDESHTMEKCKSFFQGVTKNAIRRALSKGMRKSTPKIRKSKKAV